jgi:hypothetical protein
MDKTTTAEIQERHGKDDKYKMQRGYSMSDAHDDRGILLERLEAQDKRIKAIGELADHYVRFGGACPEPAKTLYQNIGCEMKDKLQTLLEKYNG